MAIRWRDQFSCGHTDIDTQHKRLFEIGRSLQDIVSARDEFDHYDEILTIIGELKSYTVYHFDFEEKLMADRKYPDLPEHRKEHAAFLQKVVKFEAEDLDVNQKESVLQLVLFVTDWVTEHILQTDMQYKPYVSEPQSAM